MTVKRKRVNVTLSDEAWVLINDLHDLIGTPRAAMISELIDGAMPAMQKLIEAYRIVKEQPKEAQRLMHELADEEVARLAQARLDLDVDLDGRTLKGQRVRRRQDDGGPRK